MKKKITGGKRRRGNFKNNKKNDPLISVIMVVLNNQKYLTKSINSVLKQSYKNFELIIIDGGSTDKTLKILKKNNNKIDFWISEKDKGLYDAMNKGIRLSTNNIPLQARDAAGNLANLMTLDTGDILRLGDTDHIEQIAISTASTTNQMILSSSGISFGARLSPAFLGTQTRPIFLRDSDINVNFD